MLDDPGNVIGTGPFIIDEYVSGVSMTLDKNPDYWKDDEKFPGNRQPYVDRLVLLMTADEATRVAALRSRQGDITQIGVAQINGIDTLADLKERNPELALWPLVARSTYVFAMKQDLAPWDDVRVRHALQMAIDLEEVNDSYFSGFGEWQPWGLAGPAWVAHGVSNPFDTWPRELQKLWSYDREGAERLLDEAGYPRGADGVRFRTARISEGYEGLWPQTAGADHASLFDVFQSLRQNSVGIYSAVLFAEFLAPDPEQRQEVTRRLQGSSAEHLLGTDHVGRDFLSRNIYGARVSLLVGFAATAVAVLVATAVGGLSGFVGGRLDLVTQRFVDAWMAFPGLLLLMTVMSILGTGVLQVIIVLGLAFGIGNSRVVRGAVIGVKENAYFQAAQAVGSALWRTVLRHVLPNVMAPIIIIISASPSVRSSSPKLR